MNHGLSIDVEDAYQIVYRNYFHMDIPPSDEVERNTHWFLDTLGEAGVKATFFILGNVARTYPRLIRRVADEGHEIGVHGNDHTFIFTMQPEEFRDQIRRAKRDIENCSGGRVLGHRAPAFSITKASFWALDILQEEGFLYDSSIYPFKGRRYGIEDASRTIYRWHNGLCEVPLSCLTLFGKTVPVAGGGYIRHFPYWWTRYAIKSLEAAGRPAVVYMHPYEFESTYPAYGKLQQPGPLKLKIITVIQARNRGMSQRKKCRALLSGFSFIPLRDLIAEHAA